MLEFPVLPGSGNGTTLCDVHRCLNDLSIAVIQVTMISKSSGTIFIIHPVHIIGLQCSFDAYGLSMITDLTVCKIV